VTCPPKVPELTAVLGRSCVDETVTITAPAFAGPVATLLNVHTLAVVSHAVVVVVRTNCVEPAYATVAVRPVPPVHTMVGVEEMKKLDGKLTVIRFVPTVGSAVASLKPTVTTAVVAAAATLATRCAAVIAKVTPETWPPS